MKKLFTRLAILILIYFAISQIAVNSLPFTWGNTRLNTKYTVYKQNPEQYNTILIGASTTYRHIDPVLFDAYINKQNPTLNIHTFNFGIPANRTPQSIYALENLLKKYDSHIQYVVLDLSELTKMGVDNLHKQEMIYWYTRQNIGTVMMASWESEKKISDKIGVPILHAFSYAEKLLMVGMGAAFLEQHFGYNYEALALGPQKNGFYSLDQEMKDNPEGDLAQRYNVLRTPDTIKYRTERCQQLFAKYGNSTKNNNITMASELTALIKDCEKRGITLIIMLSQRLGDRYEYLLPLYNQLPEKNKISFANPDAYPVLNERENLFDLAHLNEQGAAIFTQLFAERFLEKVQPPESASD